jgi:sirohydrochlorin ferrochelatase
VSLLPVRDRASAPPLEAPSRAPLVLVGHGSRDPRSSATIRLLAAGVARRWAGPVTAAFLDFDPPTVPGALRVLHHQGVPAAAAGLAPVLAPVVVPALLTRAYHRRVDLPEVLATVPMVTRVSAVLGPEHPDDSVPALLVHALLRRVSEVEAHFDGVALLAAGTSDPVARSTVEAVAAVLSATLHVPCAVGYASASKPSPVEAIARVRELGAGRIVAAAYFLAPGRLYDAAAAAARQSGVVGVAAPLGAAPELVDLVVARAAAAC